MFHFNKKYTKPMSDKTKAFWKKIVSFAKKTWEIDDYPLRYKNQSTANKQFDIDEIKPCVVQVINWWTMTGLGNSKKEAYENLKINFKKYLQYNTAPRPGTKVPLSFADTSNIKELEQIAVDFFIKILDTDYYECFISDESSLFDFGIDESKTLQDINSNYNIGLPDIGDGNIVRILKIIKDKK